MLSNDGNPEAFLDYWPRLRDHVILLVYKTMEGNYRLWLRLKAKTKGYSPAARFLSEKSSPKALFLTRYAGSSGDGLHYLSLKKKALTLISNRIYIDTSPLVEDLDGDGMAEVLFSVVRTTRRLIPTVLHWKNGAYKT